MSTLRLSHGGRVLLLALLAPLPAVAVAVVLLATGDHAPATRWALGLGSVAAWLGGAFALRGTVVRALRTITSLLGAVREGDFSIRGRHAGPGDALGETLAEVNDLAATLARERAGAVEAGALLAKVMAEIDVAVFAFDRDRTLRLANRAGERLLGLPAARLVGAPAAGLGMEALLDGGAPRTVEAAFPGGPAGGAWELRRGSFRLGGLPHELVVLADLRRALREEERQVWQRLVRVLGHEINNSLAPIRSIAGDLVETLRRTGAPAGEGGGAAGVAQSLLGDDWREDVARGLAVIERRAEALGRFMTSYARLARLPPPRASTVDVGAWLRRVVDLETRAPVRLDPGPAVTISGDPDQLDQLLINLVRNGVDAVLESAGGGQVELTWRRLPAEVEIVVADDGPGIADTNNLFVPFFTTKPTGSGIGLVLSRQIAEAHQGTLTLRPRPDRRGAEARVRLPI